MGVAAGVAARQRTAASPDTDPRLPMCQVQIHKAQEGCLHVALLCMCHVDHESPPAVTCISSVGMPRMPAIRVCHGDGAGNSFDSLRQFNKKQLPGREKPEPARRHMFVDQPTLSAMPAMYQHYLLQR